MSKFEPSKLNRCVLIVEDEDGFRRALAMAIEDEGYDVLTACNGAVGLDMAAKRRPDAIVLDLRMPIMDGPSFLHAYHERTANVPPVIICSTRYVEAAHIGYEVAACLVKPVDIETVISVLDRVTSTSHAQIVHSRLGRHAHSSQLVTPAAAPLT